MLPPLFAPTKVNLSLRITQRLDDGYHEMISLAAFCDFGDTLFLKRSLKDRIQSSGAPIPQFKDNLIGKGIAWLRARGYSRFPVSCHVDKIIPAQAGLGGGTSDVAAILRSAFLDPSLLLLPYEETHPKDPPRFHDPRLHDKDILWPIGADLPACLLAKPTWMLGRGNILAPLTTFPTCFIAILVPPLPLSTRTVFQHYTPKDQDTSHHVPSGFNRYQDLIMFLHHHKNDLLDAALSLSPTLDRVYTEWSEWSQQSGFDHVAMSGSGSALYALSEHQLDQVDLDTLKAKTKNPLSPLFKSQLFFGQLKMSVGTTPWGSHHSLWQERPLVNQKKRR